MIVRELGAERTLVMGIVNVTPDSFSDGGRFFDVDAATRRGLRIASQGADWIDVGGESTRPGASRVSGETERARVVPVIERLAAEGLRVSVDTMRAETAKAAVAAGAQLVNDVSGGLADPAMLDTVAELGVPIVLMHWRAHSDRMDSLAQYGDVVGEVCRELQVRIDAAVEREIDPGRIVIDPGLGFAKRAEHNWALLGALDRLVGLGFPVLVGASRKRFLTEMTERVDEATASLTALASAAGVWAVRVHEPAGNAVAVQIGSAWRQANGSPELDRIALTGIECIGHHGVLPAEREAGQRFVVDVALRTDTGPAAVADDLDLTIDYSRVALMVTDRVSGQPFQLVEALAEAIAGDLLTLPGVRLVDVVVHKPEAPMPVMFSDVSVAIRRSR
ncbi:MAG: dihydropteroate synthase [Candidatus Nanopelagicales bacterium]|nr:dihydropteroate synthase [Candidatus Nanopelagicales bacterium]